MAEGTRASITCFHLAVAYVPAWSDIMLHITGELTAFSPLIPLQPSQTVFLPNQLATLIFIIRAVRGGRWQLTTVSTQSVRIVVVVMPRLRILSW